MMCLRLACVALLLNGISGLPALPGTGLSATYREPYEAKSFDFPHSSSSLSDIGSYEVKGASALPVSSTATTRSILYGDGSPIPSCDVTDYEIGKYIASGADAMVNHITRRSDKAAIAIKQPTPGKAILGNLREEMRILGRLNGTGNTPDIVCIWPTGTSFVMTYINGFAVGTNPDRIYQEGVPLQVQFLHIALEMIHAVQTMHDNGIVHLDMHANNWLISSGAFPNVYLIDFSRAKVISDPCTEAYCAVPELLKNPMAYTVKSDVWYLGQTLKFVHNELSSVDPYGFSGNMWLQKGRSFSDVEETLIQMRHKDPEKRPTLQEVAKVFQEVMDTL
jgi:serine/threonine protein kinase